MSDLIVFLTARLDETEARALAAREDWDDESQRYEWNDLSEAVFAHARCLDPELVLREVEAKRNILDALQEAEAALDRGYTDLVRGSQLTLLRASRFLAAVYSDHPDYDQSWEAS